METEHDTSARAEQRPPSSGWALAMWIFVLPVVLVFLSAWLMK